MARRFPSLGLSGAPVLQRVLQEGETWTAFPGDKDTGPGPPSGSGWVGLGSRVGEYLPSFLCLTGCMFIHLNGTDSDTFLFKTNIPFYVCTTTLSFFMHL